MTLPTTQPPCPASLLDHGFSSRYVPPQGTGANRVMIVGEAPGEQESRELHPFVEYAPAGSVLERAIWRINARREQFSITNIVPFRPPKNNLEPWEVEAIESCRPLLEATISTYKPKIIVALGNIALRTLTGLAGPKLGVSNLAGYLLPGIYAPVIPCWHPSFLRRGAMSHFGVLVEALRRAVSLTLEGGLPVTPTPDEPPAGYQMFPSEEDALEFEQRAASADYVAYDIETPWSNAEDSAEEAEGEQRILSIQFSDRPGSAIFFPWREPYVSIAKRILASSVPKLGWNIWRFDDPVLAANGCHVAGECHDLMWAWHHYQPDLPRGLQFAAGQLGWPFPWKHLSGAHEEFYGLVDVDVLQHMAPMLFEILHRKTVWNGYSQHIVHLNPILSRVSERGMPIDPTAFKEVVKTLETAYSETKAEMQTLIPELIRPFKDYKREPKKPGATLVDGVWRRYASWSPSNKGLLAYIKYKNHPVPRNLKTAKETTNQIEIIRLAKLTKDPLYKSVIQYRKAQTVLKNHVKNWRPGADHRAHTTFYFDPATGQLSSRRPNVQNAPSHDDPEFGGYAKVFRRIIRARDGYKILEFDFKSFHAQTLAFEAKDPDYLRLAKLDIHSYLAAHLVKEPRVGECLGWADAELGDYLRWIKKNHKFVRDYKAKRAILGYGFGMGYRKLFDMNKESFESQADARRTVETLDSVFPKTKDWRDTIRWKAHSQGFLISRHGYIRWFWEVFRKYAEWKPGEDSEAAIAFLPANDAFGEIKDRMLVLAARGLDEKYGLINTIHDSLLFECPDAHVEEAQSVVKQIMQTPSTVLVDPVVAPMGLSVEVEGKIGQDWSETQAF